MTLMVLDEDVHLKRLWQFAIQWLQNELERRQYSTSSYPYTGWSPPAQSNEVSNRLVCYFYNYFLLYSFLFSYFLERSNSAKITLGRARELFPVEVSTSSLSPFPFPASLSLSFFLPPFFLTLYFPDFYSLVIDLCSAG